MMEPEEETTPLLRTMKDLTKHVKQLLLYFGQLAGEDFLKK